MTSALRSRILAARVVASPMAGAFGSDSASGNVRTVDASLSRPDGGETAQWKDATP